MVGTAGCAEMNREAGTKEVTHATRQRDLVGESVPVCRRAGARGTRSRDRRLPPALAGHATPWPQKFAEISRDRR